MQTYFKTFLIASAALTVVLGFPLAAQQPADTAGRFVTVFGAKIYYIDRGSGPVVVLIHGVGDQASVWSKSIAPLSAKHRVIALDLIGFGHSDKPLLDYRVDTFVDFLTGFLNALNVSRASLVGNSLGGWVAAQYALRHPESVDRLVLVDAAGLAEKGGTINKKIANAFRLSARDDYRYLSPLTFYDKKFHPTEAFLDYAMTERVRRGDGYTITRTMASITRGDGILNNRLGAILAPTLIVWGRADGLIPISVAHRFNSEIKGSRLAILEKCGHVPEIECPSALNAVLLDFLPGGAGLPAATSGSVSTPSYQRNAMTSRATGTFEVDVKPLSPYNDASDAQLGRMSLDKQYHGDLESRRQRRDADGWQI